MRKDTLSDVLRTVSLHVYNRDRSHAFLKTLEATGHRVITPEDRKMLLRAAERIDAEGTFVSDIDLVAKLREMAGE